MKIFKMLLLIDRSFCAFFDPLREAMKVIYEVEEEDNIQRGILPENIVTISCDRNQSMGEQSAECNAEPYTYSLVSESNQESFLNEIYNEYNTNHITCNNASKETPEDLNILINDFDFKESAFLNASVFNCNGSNEPNRLVSNNDKPCYCDFELGAVEDLCQQDSFQTVDTHLIVEINENHNKEHLENEIIGDNDFDSSTISAEEELPYNEIEITTLNRMFSNRENEKQINIKNKNLKRKFSDVESFDTESDCEDIKTHKRKKGSKESEDIRKKQTKKNLGNGGIETLQEKIIRTFKKGKKYDDTKTIDLKLYKKIRIVKCIEEAEKDFPISFYKVFLLLESKPLNVSEFELKNKEKENNFVDLYAFCNKYILNMTLRETFLTEVDCLKYNLDIFNCLKLSSEIELLLIQFNSILEKYTEEIKEVYCKRMSNYFDKLSEYFQFDKKDVCFSKTVCFFEYFLKDPKFKIIELLIPEIDVFLNEIKRKTGLRYTYKRIHLFLSLLGFKLFFLYENIKHVFAINSRNPSFVFTDSNFINFFIFEMRCFLCFFAFNFIKNKGEIKFFIYNTLISFIRLLNVEDFKNVKFDDYISYQEFKILSIPEKIRLKKNINPKKSQKSFVFYEIQSINSTSIYDFLRFKLRVKKYSQTTPLHQKALEKLVPRFYKNDIFSKKILDITSKLKAYLEEITL
ncbi:hypothetical protein TUBRATIS_12760 [Tubulinosema ratisbonensis]|uniref:Uncharacterized protein n=1 Tax=Tubulinosema ratisbonensis TaxID=291195 RepID=A0A437AMM3_9MICR|nr:hypothetical protein TUBRATIS_12760 [Tubulinosema ratisbonensis]